MPGFLSYARLVRGKHTSDGKEVSKSGRKIGNPYIKWAFSEVAVHMAGVSPEVGEYVDALKEKYGAAGAWSRLSRKAARAVYYMLKSRKAFSLDEFLKNSKEEPESSVSSLEQDKSCSHSSSTGKSGVGIRFWTCFREVSA